MPWTCRGCNAEVDNDAIDDCPECNRPKRAWTMKFGQTRAFVLTRDADYTVGPGKAPVPMGDDPYAGVEWKETDAVPVLSKRKAWALASAEQAPASAHVLNVRYSTRKTDKAVRVEAVFRKGDPGEADALLEDWGAPSPGPGKAKLREARFLFVYGRPSLLVRMSVDPRLSVNQDDTFTLSSSDAAFEPQTRTVADDAREGDDDTDLLYEGLDPTQRYTLKVDPGAEGEPYCLFEDVPFADLCNLGNEGENTNDAEPAGDPSMDALNASFPGITVVDLTEWQADDGAGETFAPTVRLSAAELPFDELPTRLVEYGLTLRLNIDPRLSVRQDDTFTLKADDESFTPQTRTVADDQEEGDAFTDLRYEGLDPDLKYTLEVDPGAEGEPYNLFENVPFSDLARL